ncbi:MAG: hypothetical protein IJ960_01420, partial [Oscillospiraceae bacterium]|nr:hypothetical protein [Oscillospiraceae bacterium]
LNKSSAAADGSFDPTYPFENREIHKVFLRFPNFNLGQNLSPSALADLFRASLNPVLCHRRSCLREERKYVSDKRTGLEAVSEEAAYLAGSPYG